MAELIAHRQKSSQETRTLLPEGQVIRLGRRPSLNHGVSGFSVAWDQLISRNHADLLFQNGRLEIQRLPDARNAIYKDEIEQEYRFSVGPGEEFRIGATIFRFEAPEVASDPDPPLTTEDVDHTSIDEKIYTIEELRTTEFGNAVDRMEVFSELPDLIAESRNDAEFASKLVKLLLTTIPLGRAAAVIRWRDTTEPEPDLVRKVVPDKKQEFQPSRRLVRPALQEGTSRVHMWNNPVPGFVNDSVFSDQVEDATNSLNLEWAICVPVPDKPNREWCLYVSGHFAKDEHIIKNLEDLKPDVRFIELMAQFVGAIRQVRMLQQQQGLLGHFFSPNVVDWLNESHNPGALKPRPCEITALTCDLRGFSGIIENAHQRKLKTSLTDVSQALGVMTRSIFENDGVVGDYQGDSALGFWGWPIDGQDGPLSACKAALMIQEEFREAQDRETGPLSDLRMGIGIAHGPALAGKIGTELHAKIGAFGPVVERASKLESLTKTFRVPILLDEYTGNYVREHLSPQEGRCRRLGQVLLPSETTPIWISELVPPFHQGSTLTDEQIEAYEAAVEAFTAGDWSNVLPHLDGLPAEDRAKDFLMIFMAMNDYEPPPNWTGVITQSSY